MYGGPVAGALLSAFSRLFTAYLQHHGFTCGFDDLLLTQALEHKRKVGAHILGAWLFCCCGLLRGPSFLTHKQPSVQCRPWLLTCLENLLLYL
jgi:hypothetical protein